MQSPNPGRRLTGSARLLSRSRRRRPGDRNGDNAVVARRRDDRRGTQSHSPKCSRPPQWRRTFQIRRTLRPGGPEPGRPRSTRAQAHAVVSLSARPGRIQPRWLTERSRLHCALDRHRRRVAVDRHETKRESFANAVTHQCVQRNFSVADRCDLFFSEPRKHIVIGDIHAELVAADDPTRGFGADSRAPSLVGRGRRSRRRPSRQRRPRSCRRQHPRRVLSRRDQRILRTGEQDPLAAPRAQDPCVRTVSAAGRSSRAPARPTTTRSARPRAVSNARGCIRPNRTRHADG
jgi:hypothetical protein